MIVPSIDLMGGQAVQLVGGKEMELEAGDPRPLAQRFGRVGEVAVIDLDAALGKGRQDELIDELMRICRCRVGGGIRDVDRALEVLDRGAAKVILGTAAQPEILRQLPKDRVMVALDAVDGEVVVDGWRSKTGRSIEERIAELRPYTDAFLITFVEREGRLQGTDMSRAEQLVAAADGAEVTFAGGITTPAEIAALDALGAGAQVGMALYKGLFDLATGFAAPLQSDRPDGLWPTLVAEADGTLLGLCYSDLESLRTALEEGVGAYHSRRRGLWIKGKGSGNTQELLRVEVDCDRDALHFVVRQAGEGFCHTGSASCFGARRGVAALLETLAARQHDAPEGSYSARLFADPELLQAKLREEADELAAARGAGDVTHEAADLLYFTAVAMQRAGVSWAEVEAALDRRTLRVRRRPGDAKPGYTGGGGAS